MSYLHMIIQLSNTLTFVRGVNDVKGTTPKKVSSSLIMGNPNVDSKDNINIVRAADRTINPKELSDKGNKNREQKLFSRIENLIGTLKKQNDKLEKEKDALLKSKGKNKDESDEVSTSDVKTTIIKEEEKVLEIRDEGDKTTPSSDVKPTNILDSNIKVYDKTKSPKLFTASNSKAKPESVPMEGKENLSANPKSVITSEPKVIKSRNIEVPQFTKVDTKGNTKKKSKPKKVSKLPENKAAPEYKKMIENKHKGINLLKKNEFKKYYEKFLNPMKKEEKKEKSREGGNLGVKKPKTEQPIELSTYIIPNNDKITKSVKEDSPILDTKKSSKNLSQLLLEPIIKTHDGILKKEDSVDMIKSVNSVLDNLESLKKEVLNIKKRLEQFKANEESNISISNDKIDKSKEILNFKLIEVHDANPKSN